MLLVKKERREWVLIYASCKQISVVLDPVEAGR
jgi:hypothetical protein